MPIKEAPLYSRLDYSSIKRHDSILRADATLPSNIHSPSLYIALLRYRYAAKKEYTDEANRSLQVKLPTEHSYKATSDLVNIMWNICVPSHPNLQM